MNRSNLQLKNRLYRRQAGLTLVDSLLALAIAAMVSLVAFGGYRFATSDVNVEALGRGAVTLANQVKRIFGATGSYTAVTAANINANGLIPTGWKWDGAAVVDNYGNAVSITGGASSFSLIFSQLSAADCAKVVGQLEGIASKIHIGAAAAGAAGVVTGGSVYKTAAGVISGDALANGCGEAARLVAVEVR